MQGRGEVGEASEDAADQRRFGGGPRLYVKGIRVIKTTQGLLTTQEGRKQCTVIFRGRGHENNS